MVLNIFNVFYDILSLKPLIQSFSFLQNFYNSVSLATENYFYLLYTKNIKESNSYERTLHILYHARPMVSTFVGMSAFFQRLSVKKVSANDDTISMIILMVNTERIRTWTL